MNAPAARLGLVALLLAPTGCADVTYYWRRNREPRETLVHLDDPTLVPATIELCPGLKFAPGPACAHASGGPTLTLPGTDYGYWTLRVLLPSREALYLEWFHSDDGDLLTTHTRLTRAPDDRIHVVQNGRHFRRGQVRLADVVVGADETSAEAPQWLWGP